MSESKHTPGEWKYREHHDDDDDYLVYVHDERRAQYIATVPNIFDDGLANARLIASAPALLEALEDYLRWMTSHYDDLADEFYRATGMMAPGKDEPQAMMGGHTYEEKTAAWREWMAARKAALAERARIALAAAKGEG